MSLLMDALKRAEETKRRQQGGQAQAAGGTAEHSSDAPAAGGGAELGLAPMDSDAKSGNGLPDLNSHLASLEADLSATAAENSNTPAPRRGSGASTNTPNPHEVAKNVFAAKEESAAPPANPLTRLLVISGIGLTAVAAVGGYFYWQLQVISGGNGRLLANPGAVQIARPIAPAPAPVLPTLPAAPAESNTLSAPGAEPAAPPKTDPAPPVLAAQSTVKETTPAVKAPRSRAAKPAPASTPSSTPKAAAKLSEPARVRTRQAASATDAAQGSAAPAAASNALQITMQTQESPIIKAHEALMAGQLDLARTGYRSALQNDAKNADALVGLATVALREGDRDAAERHFMLATEADPRHAAAHAGLINLRGVGDPQATESRLKLLIRQNNADPAAVGVLSFSLGNLYAGQRRWNDAQQAYFSAYRNDAEHPDYLYNLAISLDHLGQGKLAHQYYGQALQAAKKRPAAFDQAQGERRLAELGR